MSSHEQWLVWGALAAVLQLGNVAFDGEEEAEVGEASEAALLAASAALGLEMSALRHAFVTRCATPSRFDEVR